MKCVKCGAELTAAVCGSCGFEHQNKEIVFLAKPAESDLLISAFHNIDSMPADVVDIDEQYQYGVEDFNTGNYDGAVRWLQTPAKKGNANAQFLLGQIYEMEGEFRDLPMALYWYEQAGSRGEIHAIDRLIQYYQTAVPSGRLEKERFAQRLKQWRAKKETISSAKNDPKKPETTTQIRSYSQYLRALEAYYLSRFPLGKKKQPLTASQIEDFMREHNLNKRWGISTRDIQMDLQFIYAKHGVETAAPTKASPKRPAAPSGSIITYREYINTLTNIYLKGGKKPLTDAEIQAFLRKYDLDRRLGVQLADVKIDLENIMRKHR